MFRKEDIVRVCIIALIFVFDKASNAQNPFIENKGQFPKQVVSKVSLPQGSLFIENGRLTYVFFSADDLSQIHDLKKAENSVKAHSYSVEFLNANNKITTEFLEESYYYENYYIGDSNSWASNVKTYKRLSQKNIYSGVQANYYIVKDKLKYDLVVSPNTSTEQIKIQYNGVEKINLVQGNIYITTSVNTIREYFPYAYQIINGVEEEVSCKYKLEDDVLTFVFPNGYNYNYELIIDPVLEFSTYSGSTTDNFGYTATYDNSGFLYAGSTSFGAGYPTTTGAYQLNYANGSGGTDLAITKYDTTGTQRIYSTYLGGGLDELPHSMIVNSANELFIYGTTGSADFPTTSSSYQPTFIGGPSFSPSGIGVSFPYGSDIFVSRLSADGGNLLASTFIGGSDNDGLNTAVNLKYNYADEVRGEIDIDKNNNIYIASCTRSTDFPTLNSFQASSKGSQEGCIIKMDNQLTTIIWSAYLGGGNNDAIYSLALDKNDDIYVTGGTTSTDFPVTINAYQTTHHDSSKADAFITKVSSNGNQIMSSTYFGTNKYDQSYFVEIGNTNSIYIFGQTESLGTQLVNNASYFTASGGQFIAVLNEDLSNVLRSTVVGTGKGTPDISPTAFLVDVCDKIYLSGWGSNVAGGSLSTLSLPVTDSAYQTTTDGNDFYIMVLDENLSSNIYATYFGGSQSNEHVDGGTSRFDKKGVIYQSVCAGCGGNSDFPIEPNPGAVSPINNSINCNNGVFKFNFDFSMVIADFEAAWVSCDTSIYFENSSLASPNTTYIWDFGDGLNSSNTNPTHNYTQSGIYEVKLIATDITACNISDTIIKQVYILSNSLDTIQEIVKCPNEKTQIGLLPFNDPSITYSWSPATNLSAPNSPNPFCNSNTDTEYQLIISNGNCMDTLLQKITISSLDVNAGKDTVFCSPPLILEATFSNNVNSIIWSNLEDFSNILSTNNLLSISSAGMYYVRVSDGNCDKVDSVNISTNNNLQLQLSSGITFCNDSVQIFATFSVDVTSVLWSSNHNFTDTLGLLDSLVVFSAGTFYIKVKNGVCEQIDSVTITSDITNINMVANDICEGDSVLVEVNNSNQLLPITSYFWTGFTETTSILVDNPDSSRWYSVEVLNSNSCILTDSIFVNVYPYPYIDSLWASDTVANEGDNILVTVISTDSIYNRFIEVNNEGWQIFEITNNFGCINKDSIFINIKNVFCDDKNIKIPTAFSPNGDGVNDKYFINDKDQVITEFKLEIFNRLGQKVYVSENITNSSWDGSFRGEALPPQVFDFYLEISCVGAKKLFHKGNITLIR
tara:strand:- start:45916 stop:49803 length:3888 start_codon:yes stop_codon:yes gene_type:complete